MLGWEYEGTNYGDGFTVDRISVKRAVDNFYLMTVSLRLGGYQNKELTALLVEFENKLAAVVSKENPLPTETNTIGD